MNDSGQIVGWSTLSGDTVAHMTLWQNGGHPADLGSSGGPFTAAAAINNQGQIVGWGTGSPGGSFLWQNGTFTHLDSLSADAGSQAFAINNHTQIVGLSGTGSGCLADAVLWAPRGAGSRYVYDAGNYAGKSGFVPIDMSGRYNEPNEFQYRNYCGPAASQELISNWTTNVPDLSTLASEERTIARAGTKLPDMVDPINQAIGQPSYYRYYDTTNTAADFSNLVGRNILDKGHPLITGIMTKSGTSVLNGWTFAARHIITIYGFDFTSPSVGYIYYYETASTVSGTTATGPQRLEVTAFWTLVSLFNAQIAAT